MPQNKQRYFIGQNLLSDIRSTINKVDSLPQRVSLTRIPSSSTQDPTDAPVIRKCVLGSRWNKDTTATLTWTPGDTVTATMTAQNLFRNVLCGTVTVGRVGNTWYLLEGQEEPPFRVATFSGDSSGGWAKDTTATITFTEPLCDGVSTATAANYFCSVGGGRVGVSRNESSVWHLVTWEMEQVCDRKLDDITIELNTSTCAIMKTLHTSTVQYMQMTYPYIDCSQLETP